MVEREHSHGMLTYKYWPMTSFMDFSLHVIRTLFQQDSYIANKIAASVISHSPHQVQFDHSLAVGNTGLLAGNDQTRLDGTNDRTNS